MKRYLIISLIVTLAGVTLADGYVPRKRDGDPPFVLHQKAPVVSRNQISVSINGHAAVPIGVSDASNHSGVVTESICVHRLEGPIPLLHVEWIEYPQGMGVYQNCYFLISPATNPTNILLRGSVPLHGHWGAGTGVTGNYSVQRRANTLTLARHQIVQDVAETAKPLYHPVGDKGSNLFVSTVQTTLTRTYSIGMDGLHSCRTELHYVTQSGDTLETVCSGLKVNLAWVQNSDDVAHPGNGIVIVLPEEDAERLYPTLDWREP